MDKIRDSVINYEENINSKEIIKYYTLLMLCEWDLNPRSPVC